MATGVDLSVSVGAQRLVSPMIAAAGTAGHGAELDAYVPLSSLGAIVVKSLSAQPWPGNAAPRVRELPGAMMNSVGLQGPGVAAWCEHEYPALARTGARIVVSVWGRSPEEYHAAVTQLAPLGGNLTAIELNLSCPNLAGKAIIAHDPAAVTEVVEACAGVAPLWAKLSPNTDRLVEVAHAAHTAGAAALTLVNTVLGMLIDIETAQPVFAAKNGGISGPAMLPVALRAVYMVRAACPDVPIIGTGGVATGKDAVAMLMAGANAVGVGTATFAEPRALERITRELELWCKKVGVGHVEELIGKAHE